MILKDPIKSTRITLRNLTEKDGTKKYLKWLKDSEINAYLEVRFNPPDTCAELIETITNINRSVNYLLLGIFLEENTEHIGNIKLGPIDFRHQVSEIGFLIGEKNQWGKGFAYEAINLVSDYAFYTLGLAKLTAGCYCKNKGSRRALIKAGFEEEGRLKSQWIMGGVRQDGILLGKIRGKITVQ